MAHLLLARKAMPHGGPGFGKAELALHGQRGPVEVEGSGAEYDRLGHLEIPVDQGGGRLGHEAARPERFAQPEADDDALDVIVEAADADDAFTRQVDGEARVSRRQVVLLLPKPGDRVGFAIGVGDAAQVAGYPEVVEEAGDPGRVGVPRPAQQQARGAELYIHHGLCRSRRTRGRPSNSARLLFRFSTSRWKPSFSRTCSEAALSSRARAAIRSY